MRRQLCVLLAMCVSLTSGGFALALTVPFTEDYDSDNALWGNQDSNPAAHSPSGGSDGAGDGFISTDFAFNSGAGAGGSSAVLFRGQSFGPGIVSSDGNFFGPWIADGARQLTAMVRHNAPLPVQFFTRVATPGFFPGAVAIDFVPVQPNVWTEVIFDLGQSSTQIVSFEGTNWPSVFTSVGVVQFGVNIPASQVNNPTLYTFELDKVTVQTPEPGTLLLGSMGVALLMGRRRRNR